MIQYFKHLILEKQLFNQAINNHCFTQEGTEAAKLKIKKPAVVKKDKEDDVGVKLIIFNHEMLKILGTACYNTV